MGNPNKLVSQRYWVRQVRVIAGGLTLTYSFRMYRLASENAFPGVKIKYRMSLPLFRIHTSPWLAPFRQTALETYKQLQQAVALLVPSFLLPLLSTDTIFRGDDKPIKKLAISDYKVQLLKLVHAQDPSRVYVWKFHGEKAPCKVVSIRAIQAHLGKEDPKFGNRLLVQALVKFDTLQVRSYAPRLSQCT